MAQQLNMDGELAIQHCQPCRGEQLPLTQEEIAPLHQQLTLEWEIVDDEKIRHEFTFADFMEAMVFVNDIAAIAEAEDHHPDMTVSYRRVVITLTTHTIHGLSPNDFILARKIEQCC